jgi:hypothetical protein
MTADEALKAVREWRQEMMDSWKGKTDDEIMREVNESGRVTLERIEQRRQTAAAGKSSSDPAEV